MSNIFSPKKKKKFRSLQVSFVVFCAFADSKLGAAEVWTSRQALQDVYQKMLVTDLEYALDKKVEQDLYEKTNRILLLYNNNIIYLDGLLLTIL